jgi:hypothetical protein
VRRAHAFLGLLKHGVHSRQHNLTLYLRVRDGPSQQAKDGERRWRRPESSEFLKM